jgi:hypothetical protein
MKNALSTAKMVLISLANDVYTDRRTDLPLTEYPEFYKGLGLLVQRIDQYESLGHIISDMENGKLETIGYFQEDDEAVMDFLKQVRDSMY